MLHQAKIGVLILTLCLVCVLSATACGVSSSSAAGQPAGPALHVTLVAPLPSHDTLFEKNVRDAAAVQRLYDAALALPTVKPRIYNCGGGGKIYHLAFSGVHGSVRSMDFDIVGCPFIHFVETNDRRQMDSTFFTLFEKTIGVSQLDPTAP